MKLPEDFKKRMRAQLGQEAYAAFLASYEKGRVFGLRYNPLKVQRETLIRMMEKEGVALEPVPWAEEGFYYPGEAQPGKLPLHEAGAYYIQEPSAMAVAPLLDPQAGETILDLCAAPGGKTTQIAGRMGGKGLLLANETVPSRAKTLARNIERMGVANAVVCNETAERLAERFPLYFDRILVDAPCSGEGMFRKDERACAEWSLRQVEACAARQKDILSYAAAMLKPGGVLVYSTCTFSPQEDEEVAAWLAEYCPQLTLEKELRLWPHLHRGEGHYAARFRKEGTRTADAGGGKKIEEKKSGHKDKREQTILDFCGENLKEPAAGQILGQIRAGRAVSFGDQVYLPPCGADIFDGLKTERAGLWLGSYKKDRFEPSHALAMALPAAMAERVLETPDPMRYLRGETLPAEGKSGWTLVTYEGCPLGWGKASNGALKNHYPKGLRLQR